ncbi:MULTISPECIES: LysE/ArgO family amino acid transporter [unclassified Curtobacterium]|uniref:LysE/ArgO family amino acid transporter n=1 Tax=unclassified Curtobacterium TaxID=257496 RepID=UPI0015E8A912|nr:MULTISPECIES: LysE/ArgO family amino acid transporter [unclassified Curtobacterium]WIB63086.1 LysE/ArgO family amino acid transporter [Curtobacterium sp. MCBD17_040]WIB66937.1 LysE/ArgO family amino acid transporter [Curtobacterium sp. MCBD17_035]
MTIATTVLPALNGLGTGLALIVAIGAQNAFLLRLAVTAPRRVVAAAVGICAGSDAVLILAGVLGVGAVVERAPVALVVVRFVGAAFLLTYGVLAARRAIRPAGDALDVRAVGTDDGTTAGTARRAVLTMLAFTWLNPHVYLDTLVFLGSVANEQGVDERWWWVGGAVAASCCWFSALGFGSRMLRPVFARPGAWRVFDACIAVVMVAFGVRLLLGA